MKKILLLLFLATLLVYNSSFSQGSSPVIIDHNCCDLSKIPENFVTQAKQSFRVAYGHTSHGSQIVSGMSLIQSTLYSYGTGTGQLYFRDNGIPGASDLGNPDRTTWATATRNLLNNNTNNINMIMWSWCGQANTTEANIQLYLDLMSQLETDFPNIKFVYMTGHLYPPSGGGCVNGNNNLRNEQIRQFCMDNGKILFDFADIESYDPDGEYFLDDCADDGCNYYNAQGAKTGNWAVEWCAAHPGECEDCSCAHSHCLNCQQKGKAFWWMMARNAGWDGVPGSTLATPTLKSPGSGVVDDDGSIILEWNAVNNAADYNIQISDDNNFTTTIVDEWLTETNFNANDLELGKKLYWKVRARSSGTTGPWSLSSNFITRLATPFLKFPLDNEKIEGTSVSLEWDSVSNSLEYEVQLSDTSGFSNIITSNKGSNTRFVPTGLQKDKTYYWRVRANNNTVPSYWSETRTFSCLSQEQNELELNTDSLDFGTVEIGLSSIESFKVTNIGTVEIEITDIRIIGTGANGFLLIDENFPYTMTPTDSLEFQIKFLPVIPGLYEAEISIINTSFSSPINFDIKGNAIPSTEVNDNFVRDLFDFRCSPNPAGNLLNMELNLKKNISQKVQIKILNIKGQTILELNNDGLTEGINNITQDVSGLNSGNYYIVISILGRNYSAPLILLK
ncbi:MAG: choice-of-anchor D domain-containing protein [bacterium]